MSTVRSVFALTLVLLCATAAPAMALTVDVCVNPAVDARADSTGIFFAATAPIYPGGTIATSNTPIDCTAVTATPIGTFFTNGAFVEGLPASDAKDRALVLWHFRIGKRAFDTVGPTQGSATGPGAVPGQTYPQIVIGAAKGTPVAAGKTTATVTNLDPTGFVFEVAVP